MFESLFEALQMSFMQRALAATLAMSLLCPVMGLFLVLRRSSMTGDALSHPSLAGAAAALALGVNPVVGTFVFTAVCGLMIEALRSVFRHYGDLVLTIVQALSVGIALTLITMGLVKGNGEFSLRQHSDDQPNRPLVHPRHHRRGFALGRLWALNAHRHRV